MRSSIYQYFQFDSIIPKLYNLNAHTDLVAPILEQQISKSLPAIFKESRAWHNINRDREQN